MSLLLRWQPRGAILTSAGPADQSAVAEPVQVDFDFELTPLTVISDKDRSRLTTALKPLRETSGQTDVTVDLLIPPGWGVTLEVPHPGLPEDQMEDHLHWEFSKVLLGSLDHYRYGWKEESSRLIRLAALRKKLIELITLALKEAGFNLRGIFLDLEGYHCINLGQPGLTPEFIQPIPTEKRVEPAEERIIQERIPEREILPEPQPVADALAEPEPTVQPEEFEEPPLEPEALIELPRRRSPWGVVISSAAIIILVIVGIKLFTGPKSSVLSEPTRQPAAAVQESIAVAQPQITAPETTLTQEASPETTQTQIVEESAEPAPGELAAKVEARRAAGIPTSRRVALLHEILNRTDGASLDLATFTAGRFLYQISAPDSGIMQNLLERTQSTAGLTGVNLKWIAPNDRGVNANLSGEFTSETASPIRPDIADVLALAQKHHLESKGLVLTGSRENVLAFLDDVAAGNYSFYRLIFMPWENQEYRLVLDI